MPSNFDCKIGDNTTETDSLIRDFSSEREVYYLVVFQEKLLETFHLLVLEHFAMIYKKEV